MRPKHHLVKQGNVTETEIINSTSQCSAVVEQGTVSITSDSESLQEAVTARPSAVDAKPKIKIGFWNIRTMYDTGKTAQVTNEMRRNRTKS